MRLQGTVALFDSERLPLIIHLKSMKARVDMVSELCFTVTTNVTNFAESFVPGSFFDDVFARASQVRLLQTLPLL